MVHGSGGEFKDDVAPANTLQVAWVHQVQQHFQYVVWAFVWKNTHVK